MFILINPKAQTISVTEHLEQDEILEFLQDDEVDIKNIGKMQAISGLKVLAIPDTPATLLQRGGGETVRLNGPALLMPQRGYFWDETIVTSLVEDLLQTVTFLNKAF